jgi:uncharacterized protein YdgA (DUF945 family)
MKRWLVALLVLLAVIVLVSPGIVGRLAERNLEQGIEWAESENPGVSIDTETYSRGWFSSEGRHRVVLDGGQFRDAIGSEAIPSLIIDTRVEHGVLPIGSMKPGLASTVSTFHVDPGNGQLIDLPGKLSSNVSFSGAVDSHFASEAGSYDLDGTTMTWQGADMKFFVDRNAGKLSAHGTVAPWSITSEEGRIEIGSISLDADQMITDYGFNVGPVKMSIGKISGQDESAAFTIGGLEVEGDSYVDDGRVSGGGRMEIKTIDVPGFGNVDVLIDVAMNGFDAASLGAIHKAARDAQASGDPEVALQTLMLEIEDDLQRLVSAGGQFEIRQLDVTLPLGKVATNLSIDVAQSAADAEFNWGTVLLNAKASLNVRVPAALYDMASMMNPQAGSLVAMGFLVKDGEDYVMAAEYEQGLVNVNGAPMPLPIPGM